MRALLTFLAVMALGAELSALAQVMACPTWAAFMLGIAYLLIVSLVLNSRSGDRA